MSEHGESTSRDPRTRPADPAGTQPRHDPSSLLPARPLEVTLPGEPEPVDAEVVEEPSGEGDLLPQRHAPAPAPAVASASDEEAPYAPRFQFVLGALLAVGAAAVVAVVALIVAPGNGSQRSGPAWSAWHPDGSGNAAQQIADHVGHFYRLPDKHQIVLVSAGPLEVAGLPLTVALRESVNQGGNIVLYQGKGVLYRMCGLGENCAIATGKPSVERTLLLRREALELALYSFRYLDGVQQVVVFLPPRKGQRPSNALFFRASDIHPEVERPLNATLTPRVPGVNNVTTWPDSALVTQLTTPTLFKFSLTPANQDSSAFLVLDPFDPTAPPPSGGEVAGGG